MSFETWEREEVGARPVDVAASNYDYDPGFFKGFGSAAEGEMQRGTPTGILLNEWMNIEDGTDRSRVYQSEEEWKQSDAFRPGIKYKDGLNEDRAKSLAANWDRIQMRNYSLRNRPVTQFLGEMAGGMLDPLYFIPGVAAPKMFATASRAVTAFTAGRAFGRFSIGARGAQMIGVGAVAGAEGAVVEGIGRLATLDLARQHGQDVTLQSIMNDTAMVAVGGFALGSLGRGAHLKFFRGKNIEDFSDAQLQRMWERTHTIKNDRAAQAVMADMQRNFTQFGTTDLSPAAAKIRSRIASEQLKVLLDAPRNEMTLDELLSYKVRAEAESSEALNALKSSLEASQRRILDDEALQTPAARYRSLDASEKALGVPRELWEIERASLFQQRGRLEKGKAKGKKAKIAEINSKIARIDKAIDDTDMPTGKDVAAINAWQEELGILVRQVEEFSDTVKGSPEYRKWVSDRLEGYTQARARAEALGRPAPEAPDTKFSTWAEGVRKASDDLGARDSAGKQNPKTPDETPVADKVKQAEARADTDKVVEREIAEVDHAVAEGRMGEEAAAAYKEEVSKLRGMNDDKKIQDMLGCLRGAR